MSLPAPVAALLASAPAVGFGGARAPAPASIRACRLALSAVTAGAPVLVGCQRGIDQVVRLARPAAHVFRASAFGGGRSAFAARSIACVRATAAADGVWCSFPGNTCPVSLRPSAAPSACFSGAGSGSWAALALALGIGLSVVVFLPAGIQPPTAWPLAVVTGGWWFGEPSARQLALI